MALTVGTGRRRRRVLIELYTRNNCSLCDQAEALLAAEARKAKVRRVDVDDDPTLQARYGERVPVITVDGREIAEGAVAPGVVRDAVRRARDARWSEWRRA